MTERDRDEEGRPVHAGPRDRLGRPLPQGSDDQMARTVDPGEVARSPSEALEIAARLFDEERFFEAHEFFEYIWKSEGIPDEDRDFWKGITQIAVGFCHVQRGNAEGAVSLLERGARYLEPYPTIHQGVDTQSLSASARQMAAEIEPRRTTARSAFPRFPLTDPAKR